MPKSINVDINDIIKLYEDGDSFETIGKKLNIAHGTVYNKLIKHGYQLKTASKRSCTYICDHKLFDNIDEPWKAYYLGWIWSDGHIRDSNIKLAISSDDIEILNYFNKMIYNEKRPLQTIPPVTKKYPNGKYYTSREISAFLLTSKRISNSLRRLGLHERKSWTIEYPKINRFHRDFIRGVFDGDGTNSFGMKKSNRKIKNGTKEGYYPFYNLGFFGSEPLMKSIQSMMLAEGIEFRYFKDRNNLSVLECHSPSAIRRFYDYMYYEPNLPKLERKHSKFIEMFKVMDKTDFYKKIGLTGTWFDSSIQRWQLTIDSKFIGHYETFDQIMDSKAKILGIL